MKNISSICIFVIACLLNAHATKHIITNSSAAFNPANLTGVMVGDTIRWEWGGGTHTTTSVAIPSGASSWNSPLNNGIPVFEYPVTVAGTYNYECSFHAFMGMTGTFTANPGVSPCDTLNCNDNIACTVDTCTNNACVNTPLVCNDADLCTTDSCLNGTCTFTPIICDDTNLCTTNACVNGVCTFTPITCDDGDICTSDSCTNGNCAFTPIAGCNNPCDTLVCNDGDLCTTDSCTNGSCLFTAMVCSDGDSCTTDSCINGVCSFTDIPGCPVGINEAALLSLAIYPNPVHDVLTIQGNNAMLTGIVLTDVSGKQVYHADKLNTTAHLIQTKEFAPGVYLLYINTNAGQTVRKIKVE